MRALVTGIAGFIGSTLGHQLLQDGHEVVGVDSFSSSYDPRSKRSNVAPMLEHPGLDLVEGDLATVDLVGLLDGVDVVFHLAGLPGTRDSWGARFEEYERANVSTTQRLLEACRDTPIRRFVYSSSSSVYGLASRFPVQETDLPRPLTPYGVTKLAGDSLCQTYGLVFAIPTVSLRYFSVYGPRQRPDMAIHRIIEAALSRGKFGVFGTGEQRRDFTYVGDVVRANVLAAEAHVAPGTVLNIGTGASTSVNRVMAIVERLVGREVARRDDLEAAGDPTRTEASSTLARELLGWKPETSLETGIAAQVEWQRHARRTAT